MDPQKTLEKWWEKREQEYPRLTETNHRDLPEKIKYLEGKGFDVCIIDTPGNVSSNAIESINVADLFLVPSKATAPDLSEIGRTIATIKKKDKPIIFVLTQIVPRTRNSIQAMSILSKYGQVAPNFLTNRQSYGDVMGIGLSAADSDKNMALFLF